MIFSRTLPRNIKAPLLLGILVCALGCAQTPTIDQSLGMQSVQSAEISPDGRYVAYTVQQTNWEDDEFVQQIWIAALSTGERYQLTSGKKSSQSPKWSPDSKRIAFASERDSKRQIYLISPTGGEAAQLTGEDNGVDAFEWAPDGSAIAYTSTGPDPKEKKDRKEKYGDFEIVNGDYSMLHLWLIKAPAEIPADPKQRPKAEPLTAGDKFSVH
ncbi:MAG: DPP IV N-terminal domain-containing protein, partial [Bryobacteraceae bacterium]